jgi:hypothetical protein
LKGVFYTRWYYNLDQWIRCLLSRWQRNTTLGIIPDIVIKPTIKGIKEGRDELLEEAIKIINRK